MGIERGARLLAFAESLLAPVVSDNIYWPIIPIEIQVNTE